MRFPAVSLLLLDLLREGVELFLPQSMDGGFMEGGVVKETFGTLEPYPNNCFAGQLQVAWLRWEVLVARFSKVTLTTPLSLKPFSIDRRVLPQLHHVLFIVLVEDVACKMHLHHVV